MSDLLAKYDRFKGALQAYLSANTEFVKMLETCDADLTKLAAERVAATERLLGGIDKARAEIEATR
jgi:hypothetical protein